MEPRLRLALWASAGVVGLLGATAVGVRALHAGAVLPGVEVAGVDLGGLGRVEAAASLQELADARGQADISVTFRGNTNQVIQADDFDWTIDVDRAVEDAWQVGRDGNFAANTLRHVSAMFGGGSSLELATSHDEAVLSQLVEDIASSIDQDAGHGDLIGDPRTLTVEAVAPAEGLVVDRDQTASLLLTAADSDGEDVVEVPVAVDEPTVPMAAVEAAARRAELAIANGLVLYDGEAFARAEAARRQAELSGEPVGDLGEVAQVTFSPEQLAAMITVRRDGDDDVQLDARSLEVERAIGDQAGLFEVEAVDAEFAIDRAPATSLDAKGAVTWEPIRVDIPITPSTPGRTFDAELTARQIGDLLERGDTQGPVALREVQANFTIDDARGLGITHLLGTFTTYHSCCQARVRNIQKLADLVDGQHVAPGEQFSINQISGIRTCASGFFPAGMILNGEIVDSCGGGVSQFGTTTFNAAFFAGLQLDQWKAHSFYISRYPMGREATLNYPSPDIDVRFTNDTGHGLLVKTSYTPSSITVSIYGQSDVTQVEATRSGTYSPRGWTTERRPNPALAPGQEVRVQSGASGFSVTVNRFVTHADGSVSEDEIATAYTPQREIIEFGPGEAPPPEPEPQPEPQPTASEPAPEPSPEPTSEPPPDPEPDPEPSEPAPDPSEPAPAPT